jgi:hypothetical protein
LYFTVAFLYIKVSLLKIYKNKFFYENQGTSPDRRENPFLSRFFLGTKKIGMIAGISS